MPTSRTPLVLSPPLLRPKPRITLSYPIPRAYVKASRRSAVSMAYRPTSRVIVPLKTSWFPLRIGTPWKMKVGPSIGSNVENFMWWGIYRRDLQDLWRKIQRTTEGTLHYTQPQLQYCPHNHTGQLPNNREGGPWHCQKLLRNPSTQGLTIPCLVGIYVKSAPYVG